MGNRPHPYRRSGIDFERECDEAFLDETARDAAERAERIKAADNSEEQREWEGHDDACESEFITEAGMYSPCRCSERANEDQEPLEDGIDRDAL